MTIYPFPFDLFFAFFAGLFAVMGLVALKQKERSSVGIAALGLAANVVLALHWGLR